MMQWKYTQTLTMLQAYGVLDIKWHDGRQMDKVRPLSTKASMTKDTTHNNRRLNTASNTQKTNPVKNMDCSCVIDCLDIYAC